LLRDTGAAMDSEPPTTAVLAAEALREGGGLDMAHRLQRAHYVEGRRIADADVLAAVAVELGFDAEAFRIDLRAPVRRRDLAAHRREPPVAAALGRPGLSDLRADATRRPCKPHRHRSMARPPGRMEGAARDLRHAAAARERNAGVRPRRLRDLGFLYLAHWKLAACDASPLT
jgi:hypothetical protein